MHPLLMVLFQEVGDVGGPLLITGTLTAANILALAGNVLSWVHFKGEVTEFRAWAKQEFREQRDDIRALPCHNCSVVLKSS
jgi:hypothetical protein